MTNFQFLQNYEKLQAGIMFDRFVELGFATVSFCQGDTSAFWNHALTDKALDTKQLSKIEETLQGLDRTPAIYYEHRKDLEPLTDFLKNKGYGFGFEDSWMFYGKDEVNQANFDKVKKVTTPEELRVFLDVFDKCYQKDDPQNVYGELGGYLQVAEKAWNNFHETGEVDYFMVFQEETPVAVSTLTSRHGIGYISNVGSLRSVRGQGFGKIATLYCVQRSIENKNKLHCLATEENTYPNEFYARIGFETRFTALGYTKA